VNPATLLYFSALVLGDSEGTVGRGGATGVLFAFGVLVASSCWQLVLAGSGALLGRVVAGRRGRLLSALASSAIMLVMAGRLLIG
jgi:arginine exporter protein ArgO